MSDVHTPVAPATTRARIRTVCPESRSTASTPVTVLPSRRNPVTSTCEATRAPCAAAVRTTARVCRASSIWASKKPIAPV